MKFKIKEISNEESLELSLEKIDLFAIIRSLKKRLEMKKDMVVWLPKLGDSQTAFLIDKIKRMLTIDRRIDLNEWEFSATTTQNKILLFIKHKKMIKKTPIKDRYDY